MSLGHIELDIIWCVTRSQSPKASLTNKDQLRLTLNSLRLRQNRRHFEDDVFKCNCLNENVWILIKISPKFVANGPINNIPALVQIMAWHDKATSHHLNQWWLDYWHTNASLGLNELKTAYFFFQNYILFLNLFPVNVIYLYEISPIEWIFIAHALWVLMAWCLAPGHQ